MWDVFQGRKVLLTGHTGFKGSWLAIWLHQLGADVFGYALPPLTDRDNFVRSGVEQLVHHHVGDVRDRTELVEYCREVRPDYAFHLAAQSLVLASYEDPHETFETNLMGTVNFLEAVRHTPSVRVAVNVTSDKCYDNREWVWGYRENDPLGGLDPYSASKGGSEIITGAYLHSFFQGEGRALASARAGNVIGGGDWAADRIVPDYYRAVVTGIPLMIRNPHAIRPWQHVLEPLSGYLELASSLYEDPKRFAGAWNFGPGDDASYSVLSLIGELQKRDGRGVYELEEGVARPHEAEYLKLDISKAVNRLGWRPVLSFVDAVQLTVDGYLAELEPRDVLANRRSQISEYENLRHRYAASRESG